ncbi:carbamoyl-phosphate synthetase [Babesia caballi]|uniref:Carbamoyl-phosphate synthetase n=1 Tax=Babesia caballi TaxID=5871 RepID=A0AAV4LZ53_BABCB|nr:carbamoyl-phosphate synthetase [Babesia caballi]
MRGSAAELSRLLRVPAASGLPRRQSPPTASRPRCAHSNASSTPSEAPIPNYWPPERAVVESRHDWHVLYSHAKHLATARRELTRGKCATLLLSTSQLVLEQSAARGHAAPATSCYLWDHGTATLRPTGRRATPRHHLVELSSLVRYLRYMAKLRPYYRLKRLRDEAERINALPLLPSSAAQTKQAGYSDKFARLIDDQTDEVVRIHRQVTHSHIGPLRLGSDQLIAYPGAFTAPLYFELSGDTRDHGQPSGADMFPCDYMPVLDKCVEQTLDRLLLLFREHGAAAHQCLVPMFAAVMLFGPKLKPSRDSAVTAAFRRLHRGLSDCVTGQPRASSVSFRSLAYLLNSCLHPADISPLCEFAARRLAEAPEAAPLEWLENVCFACARARHGDDPLYEAVSRHVLSQAALASPTVCLNLLWSFSRVQRLHLVGAALERRLLELGPGAFAGLRRPFLRRAVEALRPHLSAPALRVIAGHEHAPLTAAN